MPRTHYTHHLDVLRRFDPQLTQTDLDNNEFIGNQDEERIKSAIDAAEQEFESRTRNAFRTVRVGAPNDSATYEYHSAKMRRYQGGVKLYLEHRNVLPFDSSEGDKLEVRTSIDSWRDITPDQDSLWNLIDASKGILQLSGLYRFTNIYWRRALRTGNVRVTYRYGSLGGSPRRGGETEASSAINLGDTSINLDNGDRFPRRGIFFIGGAEYVTGSVSGNTLTVDSRGIRGTSDQSHDSGVTVHYCPMDVREGIASKAATELLMYDDYNNYLTGAEGSINPRTKMEEWKRQFQNILGKYSEARML